MSVDLLLSPDTTTATLAEIGSRTDDDVRIREFTESEFNWLKRIEAILRNGLPNSNKGVAETITHVHSEIELLLESIDEDGWMK